MKSKVCLIISMLFLVMSCQLTSLFTEKESIPVNKSGELNITISGSLSRTIHPFVDDSGMDIASYQFILTDANANSSTYDSVNGTLSVSNIAEGDWTISVTAKNSSGDILGIGETITTIIPNSINNVAISIDFSGLGDLEFNLNWTDNSLLNSLNAVDGPQVRIMIGDVDYSGSFSITDTTGTLLLDNITSGAYNVTAQITDSSGVTIYWGIVEIFNIYDGQISALTLDVLESDMNHPPVIVTPFTSIERAHDKINLNWSSVSGRVEEFLLQRSADGGVTYITLDTLDFTINSYTDVDVIAGQTYLYKLVGRNTFGEGPEDVISVLVPTTVEITMNNTLTEDTTWSSDYSYLIGANFLVNAGVTLTIEPGVRVRFKAPDSDLLPPFYFEVDGKLIAQGTESAPIIFTSETENGTWGELRLTDSSMDGSILEYIQVENGEGIIVTENNPVISNTTVKNNGTGLTITLNDGVNTIVHLESLTLENSPLDINGTCSISINNLSATSSNINLEQSGQLTNSIIYQSRFSWNGSYTRTITNSTFDRGNSFNINAGYLVLDNSIISNQTSYVQILGDEMNYTGIEGILTNNTFSNNVRITIIGDNLVIDSNVFDKNKGNSNWEYDSEAIKLYGTDMKISNNTISGTTGQIYLKNLTNSEISNNTFSDNHESFEISNLNKVSLHHNLVTGQQSDQVMVIDSTNIYQTSMEYNNFINPDAVFDIFMTGTRDITAKHNWWNTTDTNTIASRVYDPTDIHEENGVDFLPIQSEELTFSDSDEYSFIVIDQPTNIDSITDNDISFIWSSTGTTVTSYTIDISSSRTFDSIDYTATTSDLNYTWTNTPLGTWYVRIVGETASGNTFTSALVKLIIDLPIIDLGPADNGLGILPLTLSWSEASGTADSFLVEVSESNDMSSPIVTELVNGVTELEVTDLILNSEYYWTVTPYRSGGTGTTTNVHSINTTEILSFNTSYRSSYVITGAGYMAFGYNGYGNLGLYSSSYNPRPIVNSESTDFTSIVGSKFSDTTLAFSSTLYGAGYNSYYNLGLGHSDYSVTSWTELPNISNVVDASLGSYHGLAVDNSGSLYTWGKNNYGQAGVSSDTSAVLEVTALTNVTDVVEVSAGEYHSVFRKSDGTVWSFGYNSNGQLGDGTTTQRNEPVQVIKYSDGTPLTDIIQISSGYNFSYALDSSGQVWAWGSNGNSALGTASPTNQGAVLIDGLTDIKEIEAGEYFGVALNNSGDIYTMGYNYYGQLGQGHTNSISTPTLVGFGEVVTISTLSVGRQTVLALDSTGQLWGWGYNYYGQLGQGVYGDLYDVYSSPTKIDLNKQVVY